MKVEIHDANSVKIYDGLDTVIGYDADTAGRCPSEILKGIIDNIVAHAKENGFSLAVWEEEDNDGACTLVVVNPQDEDYWMMYSVRLELTLGFAGYLKQMVARM